MPPLPERTLRVMAIDDFQLARTSAGEYLVEDLLPVGEVNLIAGPSGAGKTTLLLQCLAEFIRGGLVLGKASHPAQVAYIGCDRSTASIRKTFRRVGLPWGAFPVYSLRDDTTEPTMRAIEGWIAREAPETRLLVIEAIGALVPDGKINDYALVAKFLGSMGRWATNHRASILGTTHAAKVKENERYRNPRQRILGTVAWAGFTDTVITIEPQSPDDVDDQRRIVLVEPREAKPYSLNMVFDPDGRLITQDEEIDRTFNSFMDQQLDKLPFDRAIRTSALHEAGKEVGLTNAIVDKWIPSALERGVLRRVRQGMYFRI